jgi:hypothetical protein
MPDEFRPIKVVFPTPIDFRTPTNVPRDWEPLVNVTPALRRKFVAQVHDVQNSFEQSFRRWPGMPGVARVTLRDEAHAKSYRPSEVFNERTCPIIGGESAGQLLISVSPDGLDRVGEILLRGSKKVTAHVSTLERIEPYAAEITTTAVDVGPRKRTPIRVRLFEHPSDDINRAIERGFIAYAKERGARKIDRIDYAPGMRIFSVRGIALQNMNVLGEFVGVQSVSAFPSYRLVRTQSRILNNVSATAFPAPDPNKNYGLVGLIDSGTDPNNPFLRAWIADRYEQWVPRNRQDTNHGSFVAGLIANGRFLNHNDPRFPTASARIVDVVAFDKDEDLDEDELLLIIDDALATFPKVKVWNLSFSKVGAACDDIVVSEFGAAIDERARRHGVLFVIASGNYNRPPFRTWPPQGTHDDRIRPPADSVRGVVVGGLAHVDTANTVVRREEPSPFTRRGPASGGIIKPDLCHYAGNCDPGGHYIQTGIVSVDGSQHVVENIGTSFGPPFVSAVLANVYREIDTKPGAASPTLAKAMLTHSAFVKNGPPVADDVQYRGLGVPGDVEEVLHCSQSSATIIIQVGVQPRPLFEKRPFPMPGCLRKGSGLQCDIFMTLLYDCPLDGQYSLEYCRNNVRASLGTYGRNPDGTEWYERQVRPVPDRMNEQFGADLFDYGYQWSPLKLYYRRFKRGPLDNWRLTLRATNRAGHEIAEPQDVVLLITIRSLTADDLVYDELVHEMNRLGWVTSDLQIRSRGRERQR